MPDRQFVDGKIQSGTALDRVNAAILGAGNAEKVTVLAGDVADVCAAVSDSPEKVVKTLADASRGFAGKQIEVSATDLSKLIGAFSS